jgi:hypothetical protein
MKLKNKALTFSTLLLLCATGALGGCATTGMDRSARATDSMQQVESEIREMMTRIASTGAALDALVAPGVPELKKPYQEYSEQLTRLDRGGLTTLKRVEQMKQHSEDYFSQWEKQGQTITNPQIRALSEERRSKLAASYERVPQAAAGVKGPYRAYLSELKEIQLFLSNDLTPRGIESIAPAAHQSVQDRERLQASLRPLIAALDEIKAEMSGGGK